MSSELVPVRKFRKAIPTAHKTSLDTRLMWLWNQRFGTVQTIWNNPSADVLDRTAATMVLQAILARDLDSISLLIHRIEGGTQTDDEVAEDTVLRL